jgi:hypothetical protein
MAESLGGTMATRAAVLSHGIGAKRQSKPVTATHGMAESLSGFAPRGKNLIVGNPWTSKRVPSSRWASAFTWCQQRGDGGTEAQQQILDEITCVKVLPG